MKILIVSNTPWDDGNSFGSSFSNIFGGDYPYEIANIYCQAGVPNTSVCSRFFQITEKDIVRNIVGRQDYTGKEIYKTNEKNITKWSEDENRKLVKLKMLRWQIFFWCRDLIWATKKWKSRDLDNFIDSFNPDIIFQPVYYSSYINEIGLYAKNRTRRPMVGYISDDCYTYQQFSLSPFFWLDRFIKRPFVKRAIDQCKILYTITETQREEYNLLFGNKCKILYKGGEFSDSEFKPSEVHHPIKFVYTGNLGIGRWESLVKISNALKRINKDSIKAQLFIYSHTVLPEKILKELQIKDTSFFMGSISSDKVKSLQKESDVLIHVESFKLTERYKARLSFSTKIVDYLEAGRCILAVGWKKTGAIEYLLKNEAALVVSEMNKIDTVVNQMVSNPSIIKEYAARGYLCGLKNHQIKKIRDALFEDLDTINSLE